MPGDFFRDERKRPLLIIHPLNIIRTKPGPDNDKVPLSQDQQIDGPVIAWGASFPQSNTPGRTVKFLVAIDYWKQHFAEDEENQEDMTDDADE